MDQPIQPAATTAGLTQRQILLVIASIVLALFLGSIDQAIVTPALSTIGRDLGDFDNLPWIVTAYLITGTAVTPIYGKLCDVHGRRLVMMAALFLFLVGSIACALSTSLLGLILARGLQGIGGGGLVSLAQTVQADIIPARERGRYQGYFAAVFISSSIAGPVLGGFFAERFHWTLIFWINVPLGLLALFLANRFLKLLPRFDRKHRIDYAGGVLVVVLTVALLLALTWGGRVYPWTSPRILGLLAVAAVSAGLFVLRLMTAPEPFIPLSLLANKIMREAIAAGFFSFSSMIVVTVYQPLYFDAVNGLSAAAAGAAMIPTLGGTVLGAVTAGRLMMTLPNYKMPAVIGLSISALAVLLLAIFARGLSLPATLAILLAYGFGAGTTLPVMIVSVQNAVPLSQLGTATGLYNFIRSLGGAVMVTVFGAVLLHSLPAGTSLVIEGHSASASGAGAAEFGSAFQLLFAGQVAINLLAVFFLLRMEVKPLRSGPAGPEAG